MLKEAQHRSTWRNARQPLVDFTGDDNSAEKLQRHMVERPSMVYIAEREQNPLLERLGLESGECRLGLTVLPGQGVFELARNRAVDNIRQIARVRQEACRGKKALAADDRDSATTNTTASLKPRTESEGGGP